MSNSNSHSCSSKQRTENISKIVQQYRGIVSTFISVGQLPSITSSLPYYFPSALIFSSSPLPFKQFRACSSQKEHLWWQQFLWTPNRPEYMRIPSISIIHANVIK